MNLSQDAKNEFAAIFGYGKIDHIMSLDVSYPEIGPILTITTKLLESGGGALQELTEHAGQVLHTSYSRSLMPDEDWLQERVLIRLITPAEQEAIDAFQAKHAPVQDVEVKAETTNEGPTQ